MAAALVPARAGSGKVSILFRTAPLPPANGPCADCARKSRSIPSAGQTLRVRFLWLLLASCLGESRIRDALPGGSLTLPHRSAGDVAGRGVHAARRNVGVRGAVGRARTRRHGGGARLTLCAAQPVRMGDGHRAQRARPPVCDRLRHPDLRDGATARHGARRRLLRGVASAARLSRPGAQRRGVCRAHSAHLPVWAPLRGCADVLELRGRVHGHGADRPLHRAAHGLLPVFRRLVRPRVSGHALLRHARDGGPDAAGGGGGTGLRVRPSHRAAPGTRPAAHWGDGGHGTAQRPPADPRRAPHR